MEEEVRAQKLVKQRRCYRGREERSERELQVKPAE